MRETIQALRTENQTIRAVLAEVDEAINRDKERYIGIKDEMDHKPGHIPTALSYPYEDLLTDKMPDEDTIRAHFQNLPTDKPLIIYCGSGVSAPWNILLLDEIGLQTTLYPGSFSGWIEDENNPIEKCI
jgi:thiosulfate/3-mercaptopyruvate sulfurtransferase